jgi:2-keto-4-pentenoate hydratase/2-oxohepta-3-ene-1,7-dioic acid hydratase in catechol pathway
MAQTIVHHCRFTRANGPPTHGRLHKDHIHVWTGSPLAGGKETSETLALKDVRLLAPIVPRNIIAVGLNYKSHLSGRYPEQPVPGLFLKGANSIIGPGDPIPFPKGAEVVHAEAELVLVIGKRGKHIPEARAKEHIFGITCGNDVSERLWQKTDLQWVRGKSCDGFGPIGPVIAAGLDPDDLLVQGRVNGTVTQSERTGMLINSVSRIISFTSETITLEPGDIIFTGTPGKTPVLKVGDVAEVEVEGVGVLRNPVAAAGAS